MEFNIKDYPNAVLLDHPLIKHKITQLRRVETSTHKFRPIVKELSVIEGYEALRHVKTNMVEIQTPIEKTIQPEVDIKRLCFVPILRAGLELLVRW